MSDKDSISCEDIPCSQSELDKAKETGKTTILEIREYVTTQRKPERPDP